MRTVVLTQILAGQYELWDYYGSYVYDYSGNTRHAEISNSGIEPVLTDRGLYISDSYILKFPQNSYKDFPTLYPDMVVSVLFYPKTDKSFCLLKLAADVKFIQVCFKSESGLLNIELEGSWGILNSTQVNFNDWKLYTIRFYQIGSDCFIYVYLNGEEFLVFYISSFNFVASNTKWEVGSSRMEGLLYQIWWHYDVTISIKTLSESMIAAPENTCASLHAMKPYKRCLSNQLDKFRNSENEICDICIDMNQSCDKDQVCIQSCGTGQTCEESCYLKQTCIESSSTDTNCVESCGKDPDCSNACPRSSACVETCEKDQICVNSCRECNIYCASDDSCIANCGKNQTCIESCNANLDPNCTDLCEIDAECIDACQTCTELCTTNQLCLGTCGKEISCIETCPREPACVESCPKYSNCLSTCTTSTQTCTTKEVCTTPCQYKCITPSGCRSLSYPICSTPSPSDCSSIPGTDICYKCNTGWLMSVTTPGICEISIPGCKTFNSSSICIECQQGYYLTSTLPTACIKCLDGCIACNLNTSGAMVCTQCPTGQFIHTGPICLTNCPDNFYGNSLISPNICSKCNDKCKKCIFKPELGFKICTECNEGYFVLKNINSFVYTDFYADHCPIICPPMYYGDPLAIPPICKRCKSNCYSCTNSTDCTKCSEGYMLSNDNTSCIRCVLYCKECISTTECAACNEGKYLDVNQQCSLCGLACQICQNANTCDKCYLFALTITVNGASTCKTPCNHVNYVWGVYKECADLSANKSYIANCLSSSYSIVTCKNCLFSDYLNGECPSTVCGTNCKKCYTKNGVSMCNICAGLKLLQPDQQSCQDTCPEFYYQDLYTQSCRACKDNCKICHNDPNKCVECGDGYSLLHDSTACVLDCSDTYYSNKTGIWICMPCISKCDKCTNSTDCKICIIDFYLVTSNTGVVSCGAACPPRSYYDDNKVCYYCMDNCDTCEKDEDGILICAKCSIGYILKNNNCVELVCDPNCEKCVMNITTLRCDQCKNGYFIDPYGYMCLIHCPDYYYGENDTGRCELCMGNCKSCEEIDNTGLKCTDCDYPYYVRADGTCGTVCEEGHYPDPSIMKCLKCPYENCSSCELILNDTESFVKCNMCYLEYFVINSYTEPCLNSCPEYYFVDSSYSYKKCSPCVLNCKICKDATSCIECSEGMLVQPAESIKLCDETCPDRNYPDYSIKSCTPCQEHCKRCNDYFPCLECDDGYFIQPYGPVACDSTCKSEFFPTRVSPFTCTPCFSNCLECIEDICFKCKPTFIAKPPPVNNSNSCLPCSKNCIICEYMDDITVCTQCDGGFYFQPQGYDLECDKTCPDGYYIDLESLSCKKCPHGMYGVGTECLECQKPCTECSRVDKCIECIQNAEIYNGICDCISNYEFNGLECVEKYFDLDVEFRNYTLILYFEYPLKENLSTNDIEIIADESIYNKTDLIITTSDLKTFYIPLQASLLRSKNELILQFYLNNPILDIYNHTLNKTAYTIFLPITNLTESGLNPNNYTENILYKSDQIRQELIQETQTYTNSTVQAAAGTCLFISLINMNLSNFWSFLNNIQIGSYLSLLKITMPPRTLGASKAFSTFNFIPNLFKLFLDKKGPEIESLYTENDIETVQFLINSGKILTILCIFLTSYLILKIIHQGAYFLNRESKLTKMLSIVINQFEWNGFTRLYFQTYADLSFYSMLNISYFALNNIELQIDFMISCIFGILAFISPFLLLMAILKYSSRIDNPDFKRKFSSIFEGYKPSDVKLIYNVIFLARRFLNAICIVFLGSSPEFQILVMSIISYYSFWHILYFRPYYSIRENIINCFTEGCMYLAMSLLFIYNFDIGDVLKEYIDYLVVVLLYLSFLVAVSVNLVGVIIKILKKIILSLSKSKAPENYKIEDSVNNVADGFPTRLSNRHKL
jgi:hypothetical protein